jgi:hypothetical protein
MLGMIHIAFYSNNLFIFTRSACENLEKNLFQSYDKYKSPQLFVATSVVGTLFSLENSMWKQLARPTRRLTKINTLDKMGYPTALKEKNQEQITNVYNKLIFPAQYIPHLYTDTNSDQILQCGQHVSEVYLNMERYTATDMNCIPQHCRLYNGVCLNITYI